MRKHKWVLIGGAVVILLVIGALTNEGDDTETAITGNSDTEQVAVPDVDGMSLPDAIETLDDAGLSHEATDANEDRTIMVRSNWHVIDQDPAAGEEVASETTVALGVINERDDNYQADEDAGAEEAEPVAEPRQIPDVTGMGLHQASPELRAAGFTALPADADTAQGRSVWRYSNWFVVAQCPAPGAMLTPGEEVLTMVLKFDELTPAIRAAAEDGTIQAGMDC